MFTPVTALDFEKANEFLDLGEMVLKRLEKEHNIIGQLERWRGNIPIISLIWEDTLARSISIIVDGPNHCSAEFYTILASAWLDDKQLMLRSAEILTQANQVTTEALESVVAKYYGNVITKTKADLRVLSRIT